MRLALKRKVRESASEVVESLSQHGGRKTPSSGDCEADLATVNSESKGWRATQVSRPSQIVEAYLTPHSTIRSGVNLDKFTRGTRLWHRLTVGLEALDVELDGLVNEGRDLLSGLTDSHATGQVRDVGAEARRTVFDDNEVLHV